MSCRKTPQPLSDADLIRAIRYALCGQPRAKAIARAFSVSYSTAQRLWSMALVSDSMKEKLIAQLRPALERNAAEIARLRAALGDSDAPVPPLETAPPTQSAPSVAIDWPQTSEATDEAPLGDNDNNRQAQAAPHVATWPPQSGAAHE